MLLLIMFMTRRFFSSIVREQFQVDNLSTSEYTCLILVSIDAKENVTLGNKQIVYSLVKRLFTKDLKSFFKKSTKS